MEKTTPKPHKTVPIFALHSTYSYKTFLKKCPKNVHKLDLDSSTLNSLNAGLSKKAFRNLIKLTKKYRNIKALQDVNLLKSFKAKKSQALLIMKRFHRVESLDVKWDFYDMQIQEETRRWLKYIKKLQSLRFRHVNLEDPPELSIITEYKKKNMKLLKDIQQRRIIKLVHLPSQKGNYFPFDMRDYPSSLKEISFGMIQCVFDLDNLLSMKKFHLITKLELFCLELNAILVLLKSLSNPQLLTSLGLFLQNTLSESDEEEHLAFTFEFIMNNCPGLEKLSLRITHPSEKLEIFKLKSPLKVLNLCFSVKTEKHLQDIRLLLLTNKNLEVLDLTIDFDLDSKLNKDIFCEFYQSLSQLTRLKTLRLNFSPKEENYQYFKIPPPSFPALVTSIACLSKLEELCLRIPDVENGLQASQLGKSLEKVARQLKRLEVDFYGQSLDSEESEEFIDLLGKMKRLNEISLSRFSITYECNVAMFKEKILENCKNLEKIVLDQFETPHGGEETLGDLILSILDKKGLKEVTMKHAAIGIRKSEITFSEIVKKNPGLRFLKTNSAIIAFSLLHLPFEHFKYA